MPLGETLIVRIGRQGFVAEQGVEGLGGVTADDTDAVQLQRREFGQLSLKGRADGDRDAVALGQAFQTGGHVHRVADQGVGQALGRAHVADAAGPAVEPDPDLDLARPGLDGLGLHGFVERLEG